MLHMPLMAGGSSSWIGVVITVVALVVIWFVIRAVLKITLKIFALGCLGLLILSGIAFLLLYKP
jgi:hypothetical protein